MLTGSAADTYENVVRALGVTLASTSLLGTAMLLSPLPAGAFWPLSSANADEGTPLLHDSDEGALAAALNLDPNPSKGDTGLSLVGGSALMANSGPDGARPEHSNGGQSGTGTISLYTVKDGDSISGIASDFGVSVSTILWANDLTVKSTIKPGMTLTILPVSGTRHTVARGETLSTIARDYDASASEIATFNGLDTDATVVVGSSLIIPGGEVKSTLPAKTAKAASKAAAVTPAAKKTVTASKDLGTATASGYFTNPVPGAILYQGIHGNNAVDLSAPSGTPIHAAAAGSVIVSKADGWNGGYGSYAVISHSNGTQTLYSHMSKDLVSVGDTVAAGEVIGYVGMTGEATGNHLHFEVRGGKNSVGAGCSVMKRCY